MSEKFIEMIHSGNNIQRCHGALGLVELLDRAQSGSYSPQSAETIKLAADSVLPMLFSDQPQEQFAAAWVLWTVGTTGAWTPPSEPDVLGRMFSLWQHDATSELGHAMAGAIAYQALAPRDDNP